MPRAFLVVGYANASLPLASRNNPRPSREEGIFSGPTFNWLTVTSPLKVSASTTPLPSSPITLGFLPAATSSMHLRKMRRSRTTPTSEVPSNSLPLVTGEP